MKQPFINGCLGFQECIMFPTFNPLRFADFRANGGQTIQDACGKKWPVWNVKAPLWPIDLWWLASAIWWYMVMFCMLEHEQSSRYFYCLDMHCVHVTLYFFVFVSQAHCFWKVAFLMFPGFMVKEPLMTSLTHLYELIWLKRCRWANEPLLGVFLETVPRNSMVFCSNEHCRPRASDLVRKSRRLFQSTENHGCVLFRFPCRKASVFNETSCKRYMFPIISGPYVLTFLLWRFCFWPNPSPRKTNCSFF